MAIIEEIIEESVAPKAVAEEKIDETLEASKVAEADSEGDVFFDSEEYQADELQRLIKEAAEYKSKGNTYFGQAEYTRAIAEYENALTTCPLSLPKDRAVYFGNIAACHMKQNEYKEARDMCTQALTLDPKYLKALLRRAQVNEKINTSTALSESLEDYKKLRREAKDAYTLRECQRAERELPGRIKDKTEKEKEEMIGKLKDLGNTILGKFGLSTDNFQFQQDPKGSGGYSMNFVNK
ncbi:hypothetical protein BD408DRAFT_407825 [Parasitella parasitica]|nr:hypothetical protein BD408DRAFT_407825 [Parasitella parasitica]